MKKEILKFLNLVLGQGSGGELNSAFSSAIISVINRARRGSFTLANIVPITTLI